MLKYEVSQKHEAVKNKTVNMSCLTTTQIPLVSTKLVEEHRKYSEIYVLTTKKANQNEEITKKCRVQSVKTDHTPTEEGEQSVKNESQDNFEKNGSDFSKSSGKTVNVDTPVNFDSFIVNSLCEKTNSVIYTMCEFFIHYYYVVCAKIRIFTRSKPTKHSKIFFATFFSLLGYCSSLRINDVQVPHHQKSGEPVRLHCSYNLEGDTLYSVKWYRGGNEFYRFVPNVTPKVQIFPVEGIIVNTAMSDANTVTLRSVTRKSSGKYKCEVSADAPSFQTADKSAEMLVVDLPESVPNITGSKSKYHVGDEVHVNCSSKSRPASSLKWYINGKAVNNEKLVEYAPEKAEDELEISRLGLKFIVGPQDFPDGILKIKCTATTAAVYYQSSEEAVEGQLPQTSPALESKGVYTGGCTIPQPLLLCTVMVIAQFVYCIPWSIL